MAGESVRECSPGGPGRGERRTSWPGRRRAGRRHPAAEDRYEAALERFTLPRGGRPGCPDRCVLDDLGLGAGWRPQSVRPLGWPGGQGGAGRDRAVAFRPSPCSTSRPTTSTSRDSAPRGVGRPGAAGWWSSPTTGPSSSDGDHGARARRARPDRPRVRRRMEPATRPSGPTPAGTPTEEYELYERRKSQLRERADRQRQWATTGVSQGEPAAQGQRQGPAGLPHQPHREAGVQGPPDRSGPGGPRCGGQAVGGMGPPLLHRAGCPGRRRGGPAQRSGHRAGDVPAGTGGPRDRLGRAGGA